MSFNNFLLTKHIFLDRVTVDDPLWTGAKNTGDTMMSGVLSVIATIARYVGIGLAAIGIWMFIHSLQESDGQGKGRAVLFIVAGAAMFLMKSILNAIFKGV